MQSPPGLAASTHWRTRTAATAWCFFLGSLGAHKFYLGQPGWGVAYAVLSWTFLPTIAAFFELIIFLTLTDEQFDQRYNPSAAPLSRGPEALAVVAALAAGLFLTFIVLGIAAYQFRPKQEPDYSYPYAPYAQSAPLLPPRSQASFGSSTPADLPPLPPPPMPPPYPQRTYRNQPRYVPLPPPTIRPPWRERRPLPPPDTAGLYPPQY